MRHKCKVKLFHITFIEHNYLTAKRFLCRSSIHNKHAWIILKAVLYCDCCPYSGRSLKMMSTRMSDFFKSVIFNKNSNHRAVTSIIPCCPECCFKSCSTLYHKSFFFKITAQYIRCLVLFPAYLRKVEYLICHLA